MSARLLFVVLVVALIAVSCSPAEKVVETPQPAPSINDLWEQANLRFKPIPAVAENPDNPLTEAKIADSQAFAKAHGVTHPTLDGALKSLEVDGYIVLAKN